MVPWQVRPPQPSLTIIVKGTFDLATDGPATLREECEFPTGDMHQEDDFEQSVFYPSDFAIFKPRADVVLHATAHAAGDEAPAVEVGFRFGPESNGFERKLAVFGPRYWEGAAKGMTEPEPFTTMPLTYEHAFGGRNFDRNPVGLGYKGRKDADGVAWVPNLELPDDLIKSPNSSPEPACFAATASLWRDRYCQLGTYSKGWIRKRWPYFPDDFDYGYFQCAPEPQQLAYLTGDESYEAWGVHPELPRITGQLPGRRARLFAQKTPAAGGDFFEIECRLDTVVFDLDEMKLNLVWRAVIEVSDEDATELEALFVAAEYLDQPPATLQQARGSYYTALLQLPPLADELVEEPSPDNETGEQDDELDAELAQAADEREAELADAPAVAKFSEPPLPPSPDPTEVTASLAAAGASDADIRAAVSALAPPPAVVEPALLAAGTVTDAAGGIERSQVEQWLESGQPLAGLRV